MDCHACDKPMRREDRPLTTRQRWLLARRGWPVPTTDPVYVHDGPCEGYPVPYTSRRVECANCGGSVIERALPQHHAVCTPEHPRLPNAATRSRRICRMCALPPTAHKVPCDTELPTWPAEPLLAALWTRVPERTFEAAEATLGICAKYVPRPGEMLTTNRADDLACKIGLHPSLIWPAWFDAALTVMDRLKADNRAWRHMWLEDQEPNPSDQEAAA